MLLLVILALFLTVQPQQAEHADKKCVVTQTVALVLNPDKPPVIIKKSEAKRLLKTTTSQRMKSALVIALGTQPENEAALYRRARLEQVRWRRLPLQKPFEEVLREIDSEPRPKERN